MLKVVTCNALIHVEEVPGGVVIFSHIYSISIVRVTEEGEVISDLLLMGAAVRIEVHLVFIEETDAVHMLVVTMDEVLSSVQGAQESDGAVNRVQLHKRLS
jgi:hypothetical protein